MPQWVQDGIAEYHKRLPRDFTVQLVEVPLGARSKTTSLEQTMQQEGDACLKAHESGAFLVAMDVQGRQLSTAALAGEIGRLRDEGRNLTLVVGGPDGLPGSVLQAADACWSLSALTFPHPLVRVILTEQLYRVWSILTGHPYHRA
jgi:23S rRNA (pseudouridine1915-N3)-methyltransferase